MNNERKFIKYLKTIVLVFMAFMLIVAGFNWFIDPYALFNSARIKGLNDKKPLFEKHMRLSKAAAVRLIKPEVIILGTSRADRGFDKSHPALSSIGRTYNLSFNGAKIYEVYRYLQHANAIQPIKRVVLMLDFIMFNTVKSDDDPAINEKGLAVTVMGKPQIYYEALQSIISSDSIRDSIKTIKKQKKSHEDFLGDFRDPLFLRDDNNRGYRKTFVRNERAYFINKYQKFRLNSKMQNNWIFFERLLSLAHAQQIDLRIAISPSHARQFETLATSGLWGEFETWKRQLVTINSLVSKKTGKKPFPFWDFSGFNFYTNEKVPLPGDLKSEMQWYWDGSHFKKELGDLVLDRMFNYQSFGRKVQSGFGSLITVENVEQHLQQMRGEREMWRKSSPDDVKEIEQLSSRQ